MVINDPDGHGTHCAGTLVGKVCNYNEREFRVRFNYYADGNAPEANIAVYNIQVGYGESWYGLMTNLPWDMCNMGIEAGAYIHSTSWGWSGNDYKEYDKMMDEYTHSKQDYLNVMAAGNNGYSDESTIAYGSVTNVGKNTLTVCSTKKDPPYNIARSSGVGPSKDQRIKPDICAPGDSIISAKTDTNRQCGISQKSGTS